MPFQPVSTWTSSFESKWKEVFAEAMRDVNMQYVKVTEKAWQDWYDGNILSLTSMAPTPTTATKSAANFKPVIFPNPGTETTSAKVLSSAFAAYMSSLVWAVPPPAPPFSAITSIKTDPSSLSAARASLFSGLIAEFKIIPPPGGEAAKYQSIAQLFYAATTSLMVMVEGIGFGSPPPPVVMMYPIT